MTSVRILILCLATALLFGCGANRPSKKVTAFQPTHGASPAASLNEIKDAEAPPKYADVGPLELQARLMNYADTYNSRIAEAAAAVESIGTPQARITAARMRVFDISANVEIAAGPYPGLAMLDMLVITTLRRITWEEFWVDRLGPGAEAALHHYRAAEHDLWDTARLVLSREQLDALAEAILKWRKANPKRVGVNYVRFNDFGAIGLKPSIESLVEPGGLFSSVQQASQVAQEMKVAIDRAFYLMSRMQLILSYQIKLAYLEMLFEPEAEGIVSTTDKITGISQRYAEIAEKLPEELRMQSTALMNDMFDGLARNSNDTITHALEGMTAWQQATITDIMRNVSNERQAAIDQAVDGITLQQQEIYKHMDRLVDHSGDELRETVQYGFYMGLLLIAVFFGALTVYKLLVARPIDRRRDTPSQ